MEKTKTQYEQWLRELTVLPTAAGREDRVIAWIEQWVQERPELRLQRDEAGNLLIAVGKSQPSLLITAHLDHPAFVVREVREDNFVELEFRGSVLNAYYADAKIEIFDADDNAHAARIVECDCGAKPFKRFVAHLEEPEAASRVLRPGDIGRWRFRKELPRVDENLFFTYACDDLAAVAAALSTLDSLQAKQISHVGVLLTRAEEVGFIGAYAACHSGIIPKKARLICLENSRSFAESPIGGGPILRVGDKIAVFSTALTNQLGLLFAEYEKRHPEYSWQRKLMPGGTCEATVFSALGYESTCLCLPLGNYHNMKDIDGVLAGEVSARVRPEFISLSDYHGLIEMLILCAQCLDSPGAPSLAARLEKVYHEGKHVLETVG